MSLFYLDAAAVERDLIDQVAVEVARLDDGLSDESHLRRCLGGILSVPRSAAP